MPAVALPGLAILAALIVLWGMITIGRTFIDALFSILHLVIKWSGVGLVARGAGWVWKNVTGSEIVDPITKAHQILSDALGKAADGIGDAVAVSWHTLVDIVKDTGWAIWNLGVALDRLRAFVTDIPALAKLIVGTSAFALAVKAIARGLSDTIYKTNTIVKQIASPITSPVGAAIKVVTRVDRLALRQLREWTTAKVAKLEAAIAHAGAQALPLPGTAIADLRDAWSRLAKRLGKLERGALPYIASGVFVATLTRFGLNWIRCDRVKTLGKGVCRMDGDGLATLLAGTTVIAGSISLRQLAGELSATMDEAAGYLTTFVRESPKR